MARNRCVVLLGFEDEPVTDKHRSIIDFTTNKIGGKPVSAIKFKTRTLHQTKSIIPNRCFYLNNKNFKFICSFFLELAWF